MPLQRPSLRLPPVIVSVGQLGERGGRLWYNGLTVHDENAPLTADRIPVGSMLEIDPNTGALLKLTPPEEDQDGDVHS